MNDFHREKRKTAKKMKHFLQLLKEVLHSIDSAKLRYISDLVTLNLKEWKQSFFPKFTGHFLEESLATANDFFQGCYV